METPDEYEVAEIAPMLRDSVLGYAMGSWFGYKPAGHHRKIAAKLEAVERGEIKRLMIFMPPRAGKSMLVSEYFPAWYIGRQKDKQIIHCTYAQDLADGFGRKIRNQISDPLYQTIFGDVRLLDDSQAANRFHTTNGNVYHAVGAGGPITGRGAHLLLIDDPIKGREDADSPVMRQKLMDWYTGVAYTRLMPDAAVVIIQCMTGDTPVLMADGAYKRLDAIRVGDAVCTFDNGNLSVSHVLNHASNGKDCIYAIKTTSGKIVRANERHPFLVEHEGELLWVRLKNLKPGMALVSLRDAAGHQRPKQGQASVGLAKPETHITGDIQKRRTIPSGITGSGRTPLAQLMDAKVLQDVRACAYRITTRLRGQKGAEGDRQKRTEKPISSIAMGSLWMSIIGCWLNRAVSALFARNLLATKTPEHTGTISSASITAITQSASEDCCATTVTLQSDTQKHVRRHSLLPSISSFTIEKIVSIEPDGIEEVFDVQIDRTENFIANGLVSHNTRWHESDLSGWLLKEHQHEDWDVLSLPAINDKGEALWPDAYPLSRLKQIRKAVGERDWAALYQQSPTVDGGNILKKHWWRIWPDGKKLPTCDHVFLSWDTAYSDKAYKENSHSAMTAWGVFWDEANDRNALILLKTWNGQVDYPELRAKAKELDKELEPDCHLIEKKASGQSLIQDMRRIPGVMVKPYNPDKDKVTRAYSVQAMLESGQVYVPDRRWAESLVEQVSQFPNGAPPSSDYTDTVTQALIYLRNGWWVENPNDKMLPPLNEAANLDAWDEDEDESTTRRLYG